MYFTGTTDFVSMPDDSSKPCHAWIIFCLHKKKDHHKFYNHYLHCNSTSGNNFLYRQAAHFVDQVTISVWQTKKDSE